MFRHFIPFSTALLAALTFVPAALPQSTEVPEGFTLYTLQGNGIGGIPPIAARIEGTRIVTPNDEGAVLRFTDSALTADRARIDIETPFGPAQFIGLREGDAFKGLLLNLTPDARFAVPVALVPQGGAPPADLTFTTFASAPGISRVEVVPGDVTLDSGETRRFIARAYDEDGREISNPEVRWFSLGGTIQENGDFVGLNAGDRIVVAVVEGAVGTSAVTISDPGIASLTLRTDVPATMTVGSRLQVDADGLNSINRWVLEPDLSITSSEPGVVAVDGRTLIARSTGTAIVTVQAGRATVERTIRVTAPVGGALTITGVPDAPVRTGDVVMLTVGEPGALPIWSVGEPGAEIYPDGAFVAEKPGTYTVVAVLGDRVATASVSAEPRGVAGRIRMNGHGKNVETFTSDLWPQDSYVYVGTHQANRLLTYDVSDPGDPVVTDEQTFDARVVNDVKVSEDGRWLVATREGASNRRNGILVFSLEDRAKPSLVSEYTETLTAGVHNVFWVGNLVYAVNNGTNDVHIIDLSDPENPSEVGRWGIEVEGKSLHDIWVQNGIAYVSYMNDGLVIADVGGAGLGGSPTAPVEVSRIFYDGGPTHTAMRYGDYVFAGDEDFSLTGTVPSIAGSDPRGPIHVIDVSDIENPRYVAKYEVPEAGAHNIWIADDTLYVGYYQGGIRVVDISGTLRGDLYAQGREIAHFLPSAGPEDAKRPHSPEVWGVFPMFTAGWQTVGDVLYATDYNSGLWTFTVELPDRPIS